MSRLAFLIFLIAFAAPPAWAHPLLQCEFDRKIAVRLEPGAVDVKYTLELSDWSMAFDGATILKGDDLKGITGDRAYAKRYAATKARFLADGMNAQLNGEALMFAPVGEILIETEGFSKNILMTFHLRAPYQPKPGVENTLIFVDETGFVDKNGAKTADPAGAIFLTIDEREKKSDKLTMIDATYPERFNGKPLSQIPAGEEIARRTCSAKFTVPVNPVPPPVEPAPGEPTITVVPDERGTFEKIHDRGLLALFESDLGLGVVLLLAAGFGAAHAFTPGHGKTMVAAYLVGERGTVGHAVGLGVTATLAHTGSVIAVAIAIYAVYGNAAPATAQGWLMMAGGLLIFLVGSWLFLQRIRGHADHVHFFQDSQSTARVGWLRVVLLGLGGGIIPCWDAVLLFLVAMAQGRIGFAIPLLVAFSTGLALVLVLLGVGVVYANRAGGRRFAGQKWFRYLPVASAVLLVILGIWFLRDGYQVLSAAQN